MDGLERFLLGPSELELKTLAENGSIVVINVSEVRSDAILIDKKSIRSLQLRLLTHSALIEHANRFMSAVLHSRTSTRQNANANSQLKQVLEWLWDVAVGPTLDELGFTQTPSDEERWPRVWWVSSGLFNILPIHAAGYHDEGSNRTAIDRVISSYSPTIKSLAYARERSSRMAKVNCRTAMIVGMQSTPGETELAFVKQEIEALHNLLSPSIQITKIGYPEKESVISALRDAQIAHVACHGYSSPEDPSQSRLLLKDWQTSPFTVSDLTSLNLEHCRLAYLSACHTAITKDLSLLDESIHLSSAVQLAGFPSVVGSLWTVDDKACADVAVNVYSWMLEGEGNLDTQRSAEGLHRAVRTLREDMRHVPGFSRKAPSNPLVWASYIHLGV